MRLSPILLGVGLAAMIGWNVHSGSTAKAPQTFTFSGRTEPRTFPCTVVSVDGPTRFSCAERGDNGRPIHLRLAGVDAGAVGDRCAAGQPCASVHAVRATAALTSLAQGHRLSCETGGNPTFCTRPDGVDLTCAMLAGSYVDQTDREWEWRAHDCPDQDRR